MFEGLQAIGDAYEAILHVSEWSGLSLGALAGCALLVYLDPRMLKVAIGAALVVLIAWICLVHGHAIGVADEDAKLQTLSKQEDQQAATEAAADATARASAIEAKAKEQHEQDLAEIARLSANSAPDCGFDPGDDDGGVRDWIRSKQATSPVGGNPQPAASAKPASKGPSGPAARHRLHFPLVWHHWLQGQGHSGNAPAHSQ